MASLLRIKQLTAGFGATESSSTKALHNITLTIERGQWLALVGESGSGKSITALSILKLLTTPPIHYSNDSSITLTVNDTTTSLLYASAQQLQQIRGKHIGMIFQEPMSSLNPTMRCGEQVAEVLQQHLQLTKQAAYEKVIALFTQVQLPNPQLTYKKYPHQLSGGQKQRVMIAMALSCNPSLLICDEPTTALDVTVQQEILDLLATLQQEKGIGILFISHDLALVAKYATHIAVLYQGSVVEYNTKNNLLQQPQHPYTKALLACRPANYPQGVRLPVVSDFLNNNKPINLAVNKNTIQALPHITNKPLINIQELTITYPTTSNIWSRTTNSYTAVQQLSATIFEGETVGLVGESGCGKTSLGRALLGLQPYQQGVVLWQGKPIHQFSRKEKQAYATAAQLIFQDPFAALNPSITIGEAIMAPVKYHRIETSTAAAKQWVIQLLEQVGLQADHFNRYPHAFSGGQRQRIVIARALALKPKFVVCDESVAALDVSVQAQVLNLLNDLKKAFQFTTLFISHDIEVVRYISNRIWVMHQGKIVEEGLASNVYEQPQHAYTQQLIAAVPKLVF
ncbi:MAG: dipeptide ABC transporter ATP-binding protein [Chitinophagaceae bacterium]